MPIYALANDPRTLARVALFRGVHPAFFKTYDAESGQVEQAAVAASVARTGDRRVAVIPEGPYVVPVYRQAA
jgi:pyruvate kinase